MRRFEIWLAKLNPQRDTEVGKTRPVVVVQTNLLNDAHPSTIVCPISTNVISDSEVLRVHLSAHESGLDKDSDILVDQLRAIDNRRFIRKLGELPVDVRKKLIFNLKVVLDLNW
ncbi:MAG: type II toxin-antitoxin system PemK/MazF family toxin [Cyclobacteriaceae bacterium]